MSGMTKMSPHFPIVKCAMVVLAAQILNPTAYAAEVQPIAGYGASYGEWAARWWEWALSIPAANNPILDQTGGSCAEGQVGNVWFLAGNFGGAVARTCTVPLGKPIFFPILNNIGFSPKGNETILDLRALAAEGLDAATLTCTLDGEPCLPGNDLKNFRAQSPIFEVIDRTASLVPPKVYDPMVADGYWLLFEPLAAGQHVLKFTGKTSAIDLDVTYTLTVE